MYYEVLIGCQCLIFQFHCYGDSACFFVDDKSVADALKSKSHKITVRDGSKVALLFFPIRYIYWPFFILL